MTEDLSRSYVLEGELARDVWDYEYDDLSVGAVDLKAWLERNIPGNPAETSRTTRRISYGRVRLTVEVLDD